MSMSKRHYEAFAKILRELREDVEVKEATGEYVVNVMTWRLADLFAEDNERFDSARFYEASGYHD